MARVNATLTGTTKAATSPPVVPFAPGQHVHGGAQTRLDPDFIASVTAFYALSPAFAGEAQVVVSIAGTYRWQCPVGVTTIYVECFGGGGNGGAGSPGTSHAGGGGGGGAYARRIAVPVTPGTVYTFVVGGPSGDTTFTGDSGTQVIAKGGSVGTSAGFGAGGSAASSTGDTKFSGGDGGAGSGSGNLNSGGGGASANSLATGNAGTAGTSGSPGTGGAGANGGGSGANGVTQGQVGTNGSSPGGAGSGGGGLGSARPGGTGADGKVTISPGVVLGFIGTVTQVYTPILPIPAPFISSHTTLFALTVQGYITVPFIGSITSVHAPTLQSPYIFPPFIASVTVVYAPQLNVAVPFISSNTVVYALAVIGPLNVPFISSNTVVYPIMSLFDPNKIYGGPGNGGEAFMVELNANGVTTSATLAASIGVGTGTMTLTGDSGFPTAFGFVVTIDSEQIYLFPRGGGSYTMHGRGVGNTTIAVHSAGASVDWGDSYDQAIISESFIGHDFTGDVNSTGTVTYPGWLMAYDSSQAYLSGDRYPMHVTSFLGVFDPGAGTGGTNRTDQAQPNAICTPTGVSDDCPAALSNPALLTSDVNVGDIGLVRYTNPEATPLDLGPRSVSLQSWYGLMRVDTTNGDVTFTDPNGIVVDTTGTYDTFTGSVNGEWGEPIPLITGIGPDTGLPTPNTVPYTTVTLSGTDRKFTFGTGGGGYNRKGWPIACLAVRQGKKRVPFWQSFDWHNFSYVYCGFGTDDTYAQVLINRNGINYGSVPDVNFPGPQDTDGPDAVWDDANYFVGASWYVAIYNTPYLLAGPSIGGTSGTVPPGGQFPIPQLVWGPGGGTPTLSYPSPPYVEGGEGGNIGQPLTGLHIWATSGKGFS